MNEELANFFGMTTDDSNKQIAWLLAHNFEIDHENSFDDKTALVCYKNFKGHQLSFHIRNEGNDDLWYSYVMAHENGKSVILGGVYSSSTAEEGLESLLKRLNKIDIDDCIAEELRIKG
jgi:hypothetical protein